jgi:hypothetical protein
MREEEAVSRGPIGGQLVLRHVSKRSFGTWGPDDYDVFGDDGRDIGRIFHAGAGGQARPTGHPSPARRGASLRSAIEMRDVIETEWPELAAEIAAA